MTLSTTIKRLLVGTVILGALALIVTVAMPTIASAHDGRGDFNRPGVMAPGPKADESYLADALGISVEDLQAAQQKARDAALDQAVEQGLLTQQQADAIKARQGRFPFEILGRLGLKADIDWDALLADALGISTDELDAARQTARDAALDQAVQDGRLTQEQADQMKAAQALRDYLAKSDLQAQMRALLEEKVNQAVQDGVITQEQADAFLEQQPGFGGMGMMPGFGGHGMAPGMDQHGKRGFRGQPGQGMMPQGRPGMGQRGGRSFNGQPGQGTTPQGQTGPSAYQNSAPSALSNL